MDADEQSNRTWRQPFTAGGIAAFANAPFGKLFSVQILAAAVMSGIVLGFILARWKPVFDDAVLRLPEQAAIHRGSLIWAGVHPVRLAGNSFLSLVVEFEPVGSLGASSDLQLEFAQRGIRIRSLLGYRPIHYPKAWTVEISRKVAGPWWGAWQWLIIAAMGASLFFGFIGMWWVVGTVCAWPVKVFAFYADREVTLWGAWLVSNAALIPGALQLGLSIVGYALQQLNLIQLLFAHLLHLVVGCAFLSVAIFRLPRHSSGKQVLHPKKSRKSKNPFAG